MAEALFSTIHSFNNRGWWQNPLSSWYVQPQYQTELWEILSLAKYFDTSWRSSCLQKFDDDQFHWITCILTPLPSSDSWAVCPDGWIFQLIFLYNVSIMILNSNSMVNHWIVYKILLYSLMVQPCCMVFSPFQSCPSLPLFNISFQFLLALQPQDII